MARPNIDDLLAAMFGQRGRRTIVTTDPAVGIYVDGVYYGRTGRVVISIERVEVLRGPRRVRCSARTDRWCLRRSSTVGKDPPVPPKSVGNYGRTNPRATERRSATSSTPAVSIKRSGGYGGGRFRHGQGNRSSARTTARARAAGCAGRRATTSKPRVDYAPRRRCRTTS
jgi:hypothetical protein